MHWGCFKQSGCHCGARRSRVRAAADGEGEEEDGARQVGTRGVTVVGSDEYADPETAPEPAPSRRVALRAMLPWSPWWGGAVDSDSGGGAARRGATARSARRAPPMQHGVFPSVVEVRNATAALR